MRAVARALGLRKRRSGPAVFALNKGFTRATGEILGFLNADDFLLPGCLARVAEEFLTRPGADVVSGHGFMAKASSELGTRIFSDRWNFTRFLHGACILVQPATFFRRVAFQRVAGFDAKSRTAWDAQLWADLALAGATFHSIDEPLAVHRIHSASISGNAGLRTQRFEDQGALQRMLRGRCEVPRDRFYSLLYRVGKFVGHLGSDAQAAMVLLLDAPPLVVVTTLDSHPPLILPLMHWPIALRQAVRRLPEPAQLLLKRGNAALWQEDWAVPIKRLRVREQAYLDRTAASIIGAGRIASACCFSRFNRCRRGSTSNTAWSPRFGCGDITSAGSCATDCCRSAR